MGSGAELSGYAAGTSPRDFYDDLAADYHRIFPDWDASMARQATVLDALIQHHLGAGSRRVLDCSCGIGTQAIGLARTGHEVVGSDLSPVAAARAAAEAVARGVELPVVAADMRQLPFAASAFDVALSADNALPHLLSARDVTAALRDIRRVLHAGGLLVLTVRDYDELPPPGPSRRRPRSRKPPKAGSSPFSCGSGTRTANATTWSTSSSSPRVAPGRCAAAGPLTGRSRVRRSRAW